MRKLATFSVALAAAVFLAHYAFAPDLLVPAASACLILCLGAFLFRGDKRLRIFLICVGAAVGFAAGAVSNAQKAAPCAELSGKTLTFSAEVAAYPYIADSYSSVAVSVKDDSMPRVGALLYFSGDTAPEFSPGDLVLLTARVKYAGIRYGESWEGYAARDIYLLCYPEEIEVTGKSPLSFLYFPKDIQRAVKAAALEVMPGYAAPFMVGLLTGDAQLFYGDVELYSAMSASGVLHVISVSGMHVAFLVGFLRLIIRRKRTASLIGIPAVWIFAAVAGGDSPVIRAAFMQSMVLLAPLIKRENDGITSLTAILALLLLINPDACASVSLQLSFSAMLGMILITPGIYKSLSAKITAKNKISKSLLSKAQRKLLLAVIASFAATIGALAFSTPLMAWHFGSVNTYAIIANILIFWAVSACFITGYIACFLGMVWLTPGILAGYLSGGLTAYIVAVVELIAATPHSRVFVDEGYFLYWLIASYAVFIIWYIIRRGKRFRPIIPTALVLSGLFIGVIVMRAPMPEISSSFSAVDVGQGQSLVLMSGDYVAVVDCGGGGKVSNAGDTVSEYLLSRGITRVDALCLTHFDDDHINGVTRLMASMDVKYLVIAPEGDHAEKRAEIIAFAEKRGTEVYVVSDDIEILLGELRITVFRPLSRTDPTLIFLASAGDYDILVTGDAYEDDERQLLFTRELPDIEIFVAGHHGSRHSSCETLLEAINAEVAVISCGYNNYGHPAEETLARFAAAGMEIFRTDELGTVQIAIP